MEPQSSIKGVFGWDKDLASVVHSIDVVEVVTEPDALSIYVFGVGQGWGRQRKNYLMTCHLLRQCQYIIGVENSGCKFLHDWFGHEMEVSEHLVRAPSAKDLDDVGIDFGDQ